MKKILIFILLAFNSLITFANEIVLKEENKKINIGKNLTIFEDKTGTLKLEDILKLDEFFPSKSNMFNSGYTYSTFWFKGKIKNETDTEKFVFEGLQGSYAESNFYYSINGKNFVIAKKRGESAFDFKIGKGDEVAFLLKIKGTGSFIRTNFTLYPKELYKNYTANNFDFSSANFVLEIIFGILSVCLFFMFMQKLQLYYLIYTAFGLTMMMLEAHKENFVKLLGNHIISPGNAFIFIVGALRVLSAIYLIKFIKEILGLKRVKFFSYLAYFLISIMAFVYFVSNIGLLNFQIRVFSKNYIYLFLSILYLVTSILWVKRNVIAKYLLIAFIFNFFQNFILTLETITKTVLIPMSLEELNFWLLNLCDVFLIFIAYFFMKSNALRAQEALVESSKSLVTALSFAPETSKVLLSLLNSFKTNVNYDKGYVYLFKDGKYELASSTLENIDLDESKMLIEFLGKEAWSSAEIIDDAPVDKRFEGSELFKIESMLILPINYNGEYYGAIIITSHYKYMYTYETLNYGVDLVQKTAIVLDSFDKVKMKNELLNLTEVEKLSRKLLESTNHELKSPILAMIFFIQKAIKELGKPDGSDKDEVMGDLKILEESAIETLDSIEEAIALAGGETDKEFPMADLNALISRFVKSTKLHHSMDVNLDLRVPEDTMLYGPKIGLINTLGSILKNSTEAFDKFDMEGRAKEVKVTTDVRDGQLYIEVYDNGKGIKKENQKKVFGLFTEGKMLGSGKGLMFAKIVIERLGSKINLESEEGKFTKFSFKVDVLKENKEKEENAKVD